MYSVLGQEYLISKFGIDRSMKIVLVLCVTYLEDPFNISCLACLTVIFKKNLNGKDIYEDDPEQQNIIAIKVYRRKQIRKTKLKVCLPHRLAS